MLWLKAFHVIFAMSWLAGLLYLPRLFVYHTEVTDHIGHNRFCVMEKRLYTLSLIAMIGTWLFGIATLMQQPFLIKLGAVQVKIALVFLLSGYQGWLKGRIRAFADNKNTKTAKFYKIANEVPAVIMVAVVILIIVKPF